MCGVPGAACARFKRVLKKDSEMADMYKQCKGNDAKAKFRLDWATSCLAAGSKSAVKTSSHVQVESLEGKYLPFKKLWEAEGDDMQGWTAIVGQTMGKPIYQESKRQGNKPQEHQTFVAQATGNLFQGELLKFGKVGFMRAPP